MSTEATPPVEDDGQSWKQRGSSRHTGFMGMQNATVIVLWKLVQMFQKATEEARQGTAGSGSLQKGPERGHRVWL